ncbi:unnamed protein product [Leptosia nina]|uniref:PX domain-containing protein n=1 Tax=Leptosia nina TaxID=320188 RepID=A0AAV1JEX3_9NEOP
MVILLKIDDQEKIFFSLYTVVSGRTAVLILARGGSKGVPLKNLCRVGGVTLLGRAITTAKLANFEDVAVSTDHPIIALEALKHGARVFKRSYVTATDWAPSIWGVQEYVASNNGVNILVLLQATSPFTRSESLKRSLKKLNQVTPYDCVFSVMRSFKLRWNWNGSSYLPINFNLKKRPRRQDWRGEFIETGGSNHIDITSSIKIIMSRGSEEVTFEYLEATDVISVELVPERKGLILKHCEYYVSSRRHGTTVTRRYNEFVQLFEVLASKYPYRAICGLPPKRVVVGGGSPLFLQRRRAALQRWLTLVARHPVLAHDADLRMFLCEINLKLEKPKHDEFILAGTQDDNPRGMTTDEMQAEFGCEQEQLRLVHLGLARLCKIFEKAESRCETECADIRELGAGLSALSVSNNADTTRWTVVRESMKAAAQLALERCESPELSDEEGQQRLLLALDALVAYKELCSRLTRGLHAERAAAAASAPHSAASRRLRDRHHYAMRCALEEARVARAYALSALETLPAILHILGTAHARIAACWADLHTALRHASIKASHR